MYKTHYLRCKSLHSLPKFASKTQRIQVGNGQYVSVLFITPIVIAMYMVIDLRYIYIYIYIIYIYIYIYIYMLVSEIHENCRFSFRIKEKKLN